MVPPPWCFLNPQRGNNRKASASSSALRRRSWRFQSSFSKDSAEPMGKTIQNVYWHVLTMKIMIFIMKNLEYSADFLTTINSWIYQLLINGSVLCLLIMEVPPNHPCSWHFPFKTIQLLGQKNPHGNPETWTSGRTRRRCGPPAVHDPSLPGLTFQGFHEKTDPQFIGSWVVRWMEEILKISWKRSVVFPCFSRCL